LINYVYPQKPLDGGTTLEPHEDTRCWRAVTQESP